MKFQLDTPRIAHVRGGKALSPPLAPRFVRFMAAMRRVSSPNDARAGPGKAETDVRVDR